MLTEVLGRLVPGITEAKAALLAGHIHTGYHIELQEGLCPLKLMVEGWYTVLSAEDYIVVAPKAGALGAEHLIDKLTEADVPSWSVVYYTFVPRGAATVVEARKHKDLRDELLLTADVHYCDCSQEVFICWQLAELATKLLEVLDRPVMAT